MEINEKLVRMERRLPPSDAQAVQNAKQQPGAHLYDINWPYTGKSADATRSHSRKLAARADGNLTDTYAANTRYRPVIRSDRTVKAYMHAAAKTNPDQWMVEIDPRGEALVPNIPDHFIRGWWYADKNGKITDQFRPNSLWIDDSFSTNR